MTINTIENIEASVISGELKSFSQAGPAEDFSKYLDAGIKELNDNIYASETAVRELAVGENNNLHQILIQIEKTKMSFQLALQVRSKVLEAYHEIMRMQV